MVVDTYNVGFGHVPVVNCKKVSRRVGGVEFRNYKIAFSLEKSITRHVPVTFFSGYGLMYEILWYVMLDCDSII